MTSHGRLGGALHGTVVEFKAGREFLWPIWTWHPPDGDAIGRMALEGDLPSGRRGHWVVHVAAIGLRQEQPPMDAVLRRHCRGMGTRAHGAEAYSRSAGPARRRDARGSRPHLISDAEDRSLPDIYDIIVVNRQQIDMNVWSHPTNFGR